MTLAGSQAAAAIPATPLLRGHDHEPADLRGRGQGVEGPGQQRPPADVGRELVDPAHPRRASGRDDDGVRADGGRWRVQSRRGWAKIIRPATVWSTRVTDTSSSRSM